MLELSTWELRLSAWKLGSWEEWWNRVESRKSNMERVATVTMDGWMDGWGQTGSSWLKLVWQDVREGVALRCVWLRSTAWRTGDPGLCLPCQISSVQMASSINVAPARVEPGPPLERCCRRPSFVQDGD